MVRPHPFGPFPIPIHLSHDLWTPSQPAFINTHHCTLPHHTFTVHKPSSSLVSEANLITTTMSEEKHHRHLFHHKDKPVDDAVPYSDTTYSDTSYATDGVSGYAAETTEVLADDPGPDYRKEEKHHKHLEHLGELGVAAAGAYALHEKHKSEKDPEHAHKHKIEEEIAAAAAVGAGGFAFHEHHEKKEAKEEDEEAHGKKHHHLF